MVRHNLALFLETEKKQGEEGQKAHLGIAHGGSPFSAPRSIAFGLVILATDADFLAGSIDSRIDRYFTRILQDR